MRPAALLPLLLLFLLAAGPANTRAQNPPPQISFLDPAGVPYLRNAEFSGLRRRHARRPSAMRALRIANQHLLRRAPDSALTALEPFAGAPDAPVALHERLAWLYFEDREFAAAQRQVDALRRGVRDFGAYRRLATLVALGNGEPVDYLSPAAGLPLAEALSIRAHVAAVTGDLASALFAAEAAVVASYCESTPVHPDNYLLLAATYQRLLTLSLARQDWPAYPYPEGSFEAVYVDALEGAFAAVTAEGQPRPPAHEIVYLAVTRAHAALLARGALVGRQRLWVATLAKLHERQAYRAVFFYALNGADSDEGWFVQYIHSPAARAVPLAEVMTELRVCDVLAGLPD